MRSCERSYPGHRRRGGLQRGAGLTVNEAQFDETTHGLGESLVDRKIQKKKKFERQFETVLWPYCVHDLLTP